MSIQAPLGFEDHLPDRMPVWRRIEEAARRVAETYGYREMRTPLLESTELFIRSVGEVTDIVEKEMFTFDKGEKDSLTLRPELTASFVRACVEHGLFKKKAFQKLFYVGANFRKERPQKGRLRQFHQFGVEALGATDPLLDAETVLLALRFLEELGVPGVKTKVNSIGCPNCRPKYRDALKAKFAPLIGQFCENCRRRFDRNVFRILDCKVEKDVALTADAPRVQDSLCADCLAHDKAFVEALTRAGCAFTQDPRLVRGFDYYTRTVYEFTASGLGAQDAIGGGGRYDNLIEEMGGDKAGAVGFAIGLERVVIALEAAGKAPEEEWFPTTAFVTHIGPETRQAAFDLVLQLRKAGISADMDFQGRSLKAQMRSANQVASLWSIIIGPDELASGDCKLVDLSSQSEQRVPLASLQSRLQASPEEAPDETPEGAEARGKRASVTAEPLDFTVPAQVGEEFRRCFSFPDPEQPVFVLQGWPEEASDTSPEIQRVFDAGGLQEQVQNFQPTRVNGFSMKFEASAPKPLDGGGFGISFAARRSLSVRPSGVCTFAASGGPAWLCRASSSFSKDPVVNPWVLFDSILDFCRLEMEIIAKAQPPGNPAWTLGFGVFLSQAQSKHALRISRGAPRQFMVPDTVQAPGRRVVAEVRHQSAATPAARIAFDLIRSVYDGFGIGIQDIPFLTPQRDAIDLTAFLR